MITKHDISQDNRVIAHRQMNGQIVSGRDAFAARCDPQTKKDRDASHLAVLCYEDEQPALGTFSKDKLARIAKGFPIDVSERHVR